MVVNRYWRSVHFGCTDHYFSSRTLHTAFKREMDRIFVCILDIFLLVLLIWTFTKLFKNSDANYDTEFKWNLKYENVWKLLKQMALVRQKCGAIMVFVPNESSNFINPLSISFCIFKFFKLYFMCFFNQMNLKVL